MRLVRADTPALPRDEDVEERGSGQRVEELGAAIGRERERLRELEATRSFARGVEATKGTLRPDRRELTVGATEPLDGELRDAAPLVHRRDGVDEGVEQRSRRARARQLLETTRDLGARPRVVGDGEDEVVPALEVQVDRLARDPRLLGDVLEPKGHAPFQEPKRSLDDGRARGGSFT